MHQLAARQQIAERLPDAEVPDGITPTLGPNDTPVGQIYQYTLENPNDGERALTKDELVQRRIVQDWVARPLLRSIPGVAEINPGWPPFATGSVPIVSWPFPS